MRVGFAETDVTPDLPADRPEGIGYGRAPNVHDRCKARAVVFGDGEDRVALVGCDLESMLRSVVLGARQDIEAVCGIPPERVLVCASHAHSAGFASIVEPGLFDHASDLVKHLAYDLSACPSEDYMRFVRRQITVAVVAADRDRVEAVCNVGSGHEGGVTFNRRLLMKNGKTQSHPGKGNPDIVGPAGPIDPEVGTLGVWDTQGRMLGCVVNFACHGTARPGGWSADWVYYLEQTIRGVMGRDAVVVFLNGACGDITQIDNQDMRTVEIGEAASRRVGQCVGAEALKVLARAEPGDLAQLGAQREILRIKRRVPCPERVKRAVKIASEDFDEAKRHEWVYAKKLVMLDALVAKQPGVDVEVQAIQVGPALFVSNPAELFCRLGLGVKAGSPFPFTYVVEMANGCVGYCPDEEAWGEGGGGFETRLTDYANLEPTAGRQIADASLRLARSLTPGQVPRPEEGPPFPPWEAGIGLPEFE